MYKWKRLEAMVLYFTKVAEKDTFDTVITYTKDDTVCKDFYVLTLNHIDENYQLNEALSIAELKRKYSCDHNFALYLTLKEQTVLLNKGGTYKIPFSDKVVKVLGQGIDDLPELEQYELKGNWYKSVSLDRALLRFTEATKESGDTIVIYENHTGEKVSEYFSLIEGIGEKNVLSKSNLVDKYNDKKVVEIYINLNEQKIVAGSIGHRLVRAEISPKVTGTRLYLSAPFMFYLPESEPVFEKVY